MENLLPSVALVDSGGAFLPLQSEIFPDRDHGGRNFYNIAASSQLGIPQMSVGKGCFSFPVRSLKSNPVLKTFRIEKYDFRVETYQIGELGRGFQGLNRVVLMERPDTRLPHLTLKHPTWISMWKLHRRWCLYADHV